MKKPKEALSFVLDHVGGKVKNPGLKRGRQPGGRSMTFAMTFSMLQTQADVAALANSQAHRSPILKVDSPTIVGWLKCSASSPKISKAFSLHPTQWPICFARPGETWAA